MEKVIHICDVCGHEETYDSNHKTQYRKALLVIGKNNTSYISLDSYNYSYKKEMLLCPECQKKIGVTPEDKIEQARNEQAIDIRDKLLNVFTEIADELGYVRQ